MVTNPTTDQISRDGGHDHLDFRALFSEADAHFVRSADIGDLESSFSGVLVTSAIAKCLDFNNQANKGATAEAPSSFFLIANARGMCEELIYCSLFKRLGQQRSDALAKRLNNLALQKNVLAPDKVLWPQQPGTTYIWWIC